MAKKTPPEKLPARVSITFRAEIDEKLAGAFPPDDPRLCAESIGNLFHHAVSERLEMKLRLLGQEPKDEKLKMLHDAHMKAIDQDIAMLQAFEVKPAFIRIRTKDGEVWPTSEAIRAHLAADRVYAKHKKAEARKRGAP